MTNFEVIKKAKAIREWLAELSGLIPRLNEGPNPYYGATLGGLTLIHYYGGPSAVGTPFGQWACTGGGCLKDPDWYEKAKERLGLRRLVERKVDNMGEYGPVDLITKDLDGNPLPWYGVDLVRLGWGGLQTRNIFEHVRAEEAKQPMLPNVGPVFTKKIILEMAEQYGVKVDPKDYEDASDEKAVSMVSVEILREVWTRDAKPAVGFRDWMDERDNV